MNSENQPRGGTDLETSTAQPETEDYAGEIQVAGGEPPRWSTRVPYVAIVLALAYYLYVRATDPVNLVFATLFIVWLIYTPIAKRRGWFFIPLG
jgi:hypothetical protein